MRSCLHHNMEREGWVTRRGTESGTRSNQTDWAGFKASADSAVWWGIYIWTWRLRGELISRLQVSLAHRHNGGGEWDNQDCRTTAEKNILSPFRPKEVFCPMHINTRSLFCITFESFFERTVLVVMYWDQLSCCIYFYFIYFLDLVSLLCFFIIILNCYGRS